MRTAYASNFLVDWGSYALGAGLALSAETAIPGELVFGWPTVGYREPMLWRSNLLGILYLIVGIIVASNRNYLSGINDIQEVAEALLAIVLWPLVLLGVSMRF